MHDLSRLVDSRRDTIVARLSQGEAVVAARLAVEFGVSEDVVRRDLREIAARGLCKRVYGGALPVSPAAAAIAVRTESDPDRKLALARAAATLLRPKQSIFLDSGSTNARLASLLPGNLQLTVVTNSIQVAAAATGRPGVALFLIGGGVNSHVGACIGTRAAAELQRHRIDLGFIGACAISAADGLCGFEPEEVDFKRALLGISKSAVVMASNEKLETTAPHLIAPLAGIDRLIVEHDAPPATLERLTGSGALLMAALPPDTRVST
jgi:DeoR/GlpR family transcriptional regulator of sugar metabolism